MRRGLGEPRAARAFLAAGGVAPARRLAGAGRGRRGGSSATSSAARGSPCTATTTSTACARPRSSCARCARSARTSTGTCRAGSTTATASRSRPWSGSPRAGRSLLITVDCAVTAVEEVAAARAAGMDVVVTDHHSPRADGALPDAPLVHPRLNGYPCADLCAAGVAYKLAQALLAGAGEDPALADEDLDLVALATVADVVPLQGENRRLVRAGLRALAGTRKVGLRALMDVSRVDPSGLDESAIGFRLGPRLNAAGRLYRADAGLELLLTEDRDRARAVARSSTASTPSAATSRRGSASRPRRWSPSIPRAAPWCWPARAGIPGVIGIVASRIAERHHRPAILIALDGEEGTRLGPLDPRLRPARRPARERRAPAALRRPQGGGGPDDRALGGRRLPRGVPRARRRGALARGPRAAGADRRGRPGRRAVAGPRRGAAAARAVRHGQPGASRCSSRRRRCPTRSALGEGRHVALHAQRRRRALALRRLRRRRLAAGRRRASPPTPPSGWRSTAGTARCRRGWCCAQARACAAGRSSVIGEPAYFARRAAARARPGPAQRAAAAERARRSAARSATCAAPGIAGLLGDLVATGEPVLAVTAHAPHRAGALAAARGRLRAHLVGRAGGRSGPRRAVHRTSWRRPAAAPAAGPSVRGGVDAPGVGYA